MVDDSDLEPQALLVSHQAKLWYKKINIIHSVVEIKLQIILFQVWEPPVLFNKMDIQTNKNKKIHKQVWSSINNHTWV